VNGSSNQANYGAVWGLGDGVSVRYGVHKAEGYTIHVVSSYRDLVVWQMGIKLCEVVYL
jgi:hypothetical protein